MVIYEGRSQINGDPIVAILTINSKNPKTGDAIQSWILPANVSPVDAVRTGADRAVCGDCPQRHHLGGACYVQPFQGPRSVWEAWKRGKYDSPENIKAVRAALQAQTLRMGSWGDPCAVPVDVWRKFIADGPGNWTGYTHQWKRPRSQAYRDFLMASVDNEAQAERAREMGWRFFLVSSGARDPENASVPARTVECLSDAQGLSCDTCKICDGNRFDGATARASVWISAHGARASKYSLNVLR